MIDLEKDKRILRHLEKALEIFNSLPLSLVCHEYEKTLKIQELLSECIDDIKLHELNPTRAVSHNESMDITISNMLLASKKRSANDVPEELRTKEDIDILNEDFADEKYEKPGKFKQFTEGSTEHEIKFDVPPREIKIESL